jgi:phenylacetic acid degradation operon negative regulatory protein
LNIFWRQLDKRERERELRRTISYMKTKNLLQGDYEHGLQITNKGRERIEKVDFEKLSIVVPKMWDQKWRLVFFDIPEDHKYARDMLARKLRSLGFYQLQKSAWIHPFPCRDVIEKVCTEYKVDRYISYVEVTYIDNQQKLKERFKKII